MMVSVVVVGPPLVVAIELIAGFVHFERGLKPEFIVLGRGAWIRNQIRTVCGHASA